MTINFIQKCRRKCLPKTSHNTFIGRKCSTNFGPHFEHTHIIGVFGYSLNELYAQQDTFDVLHHLHSLQKLVATNNKFSFFSKRDFTTHTFMQTFDIRDNYISPRHLKRIQKYLPDCTILTSIEEKIKNENYNHRFYI